MSITSATRFTNVGIFVAASGAMNLQVNEDGGAQQYWRFGQGTDDYTVTKLADLTALQAIWASTAGLQNADGDSIDVSIHNLSSDFVSDETELVNAGLFNPLDANEYSQRRSLGKVQGALRKHGGVAEDSTSGRADIESSGGWVPVKSIPRTGVMDQSLQDVRALEWGSFFQLRLVLPSDIEITATSENANQDPRIIGLAVAFENIRDTEVAGNPVYNDAVEELDSVADLHFIGQDSTQNVYEFDQDVGTPVSIVRFAVTSMDVDHNGNGLLRIFCIGRTGTATPDVAMINQYLDETTARVRSKVASESPPMGSTAVQLYGDRLWLDSYTYIAKGPDGGISIRGRDPAGEGGEDFDMTIGGPYARSRQYSDLQTNAQGRKAFPVSYGIDSIHFAATETANGILQIPNPDIIVPHPGMDRLMSFHNLNATYTMEILDWDGNNVITLAPGEGDVQLRAILYKNGNGELVGVGPIVREYLLASGGAVSNRFGSGFVDVSDTHYGRPIPLEVAANRTADRFAVEAFARGTGVITNGQSIGALGLRVPESVEFSKGGLARWEMDLTVTSATSGQMPSNHGLQVFQNGTAFPRFTQRQWGTYDSRHWGGLIETEVELGDVITPFISYPNTGVTMPVQNMGLFSYRLLILLTLNISVAYTAEL